MKQLFALSFAQFMSGQGHNEGLKALKCVNYLQQAFNEGK